MHASSDVIDPTYLPFTADALRAHFTSNADEHIAEYRASAERYQRFQAEQAGTTDLSLSNTRWPRQIEKDERFWTVTTLKRVFDHPAREAVLAELLRGTFGETPPVEGLPDWATCIRGELHLYFEPYLPSPPSYTRWLRDHLAERQLLPYAREVATRQATKALEGPTHADAIFVNASNGFGWLIEAKVLSDVATAISFDNFRNQLARNIDVMLEKGAATQEGAAPLAHRLPQRTLFGLLTPAVFKTQPWARLYGWLMREYRQTPAALGRDLPHRCDRDWPAVSRRLGWLTFEEIEAAAPGSCPWMRPEGRATRGG